MKKSLMFAGLFLILSLSVFVSGQETFCIDSDGGKNYYEIGTVNFVSLGENSTLQDKCYDGKILLEYSCEENMVRTENFDCPSGCSEGVCIVSGDEKVYCTDSDHTVKTIKEKVYTISANNPNFFREGLKVEQTYTDINTREEFYFSDDVPAIEEGWTSVHVEEQDDGTVTITYTQSEGRNGERNFVEKGFTYGKETILSQEFIGGEDYCVLTEKIPVSELDMRSNNPEGKSSEEFGEGAFWQHENDATYLVRCLNGNCDTARVEECEGENCAVMEYGCSKNRLGGLSEAEAIKYYLLHPIQFFRDYNTLFKKAWDENQGFVYGSILDVNYLGGTPSCTDGKFVGSKIQELLGED